MSVLENAAAIKNGLLINTIDLLSPKQGPIEQQGGASIHTFPVTQAFRDAIAQQLAILESAVALNQRTHPLLTSHYIDGFVLFDSFDALIVQLYKQYVQAYLGRTAKLDFASLYYYDPSVIQTKGEITSSYFHHDSVGNRIKIFIPITDHGTKASPTQYISGTNRLRRISFSNAIRNIETDKRIEMSYGRAREISLSLGQALVFDTNGLHRGCYNPASKEPRYILQLEFSSRIKSSVIRGDIGLRKFYLKQKTADLFVSNHMLSENKLKPLVQSDVVEVDGKIQRNTRVINTNLGLDNE